MEKNWGDTPSATLTTLCLTESMPPVSMVFVVGKFLV